MIDKKYNKNYFNRNSLKNKNLFKKYLKLLMKNKISMKNISLCDIGCATGEFINMMKDTNLCFGVDTSRYAITECKKRFPKIKNNFFCLDLNSSYLDINQSFDIITLFDVIEHLENFSNFKKLILEKLKNNGYLIVTTPNANSILRLILKKGFTGELDKTHTILFTPYTLDFFLRRIGLKRIALFTPFRFYMKYNFLTKNLLFGGQIYAIYKKV